MRWFLGVGVGLFGVFLLLSGCEYDIINLYKPNAAYMRKQTRLS